LKLIYSLLEKANEFSIGRDEKCSLPLKVNVVSHRHCRFTREPGDTAKDDIVFLEDLRYNQLNSGERSFIRMVTESNSSFSTNGTFVNGEKLGKNNKILMTNGTEVMICAKRNGNEKVRIFVILHKHLRYLEFTVVVLDCFHLSASF